MPAPNPPPSVRPAPLPPGSPDRRARAAALVLALLALGPGVAPEAAGARARNESEARAELARVRERIKRITEGVQDDVARRDSVAAELRDADKGIAGARARLEKVRAARADSERRRERLRAEQAKAQAQLEGERGALGAQLRSAYMAGREEQLKVLLSGGDPATLGRMLGYYAYFGRARAATIAAIDQQVAHLDALDQELAAEDARLADLERQRRDEVGALDVARGRREHALGTLQARIANRSTELKELQANAAALEQLVEKLRVALEEFDAGDVAGNAKRPFAQVRGKLPWPARGHLVASYGDARPGGLHWNGVLLETAPGTAVRAPYYGRVVYADWLTGLGQLVILDHGGGYMSLYANNDRIHTQVGARVQPGDVLATSSDGSAFKPELYFEIRLRSRPLDPRPWLKGEPGR